MVLLIISGFISVVGGIVFLSGEEKVRAINKIITDLFNKSVIETDKILLKYREGTGICLILLGLLYFFIAYWLKVRATVTMAAMFIHK